MLYLKGSCMTSESGNKPTTGDGSPALGVDEIDAVDPEAIAALDDEPNREDSTAEGESLAHEAPTPERFAEFVEDVDAGRVAASDGTEEAVPIDASMDELFAER